MEPWYQEPRTKTCGPLVVKFGPTPKLVEPFPGDLFVLFSKNVLVRFGRLAFWPGFLHLGSPSAVESRRRWDAVTLLVWVFFWDLREPKEAPILAFVGSPLRHKSNLRCGRRGETARAKLWKRFQRGDRKVNRS